MNKGCTPHPNPIFRVKAKSPEVQEGADGGRDFGGAKGGCSVTLQADTNLGISFRGSGTDRNQPIYPPFNVWIFHLFAFGEDKQ